MGGELIYVRKGVHDTAAAGEPRQLLDFRMGSVRGRGLHFSTFQLNLSRF